MPQLLAQLDDLKQLLGSDVTDHDALLTALLDRASAVAEGLVGVREGFLRRSVGVVEFPFSDLDQSVFLRLARRPIEAIASVRQLDQPGTDADFDAAEDLVENEDYTTDDWLATLERIHTAWWLRRRCVRVIYTAGFVDPSEEVPPVSAIAVPQDLQHGVLQQAIRMFQTRDSAGLRQFSTGEGTSITTVEAEPHPALVDACFRLRRWA